MRIYSVPLQRVDLMSTFFGNDPTAPFRTRVGIVLLQAEEDGQGMCIEPCSE